MAEKRASTRKSTKIESEPLQPQRIGNLLFVNLHNIDFIFISSVSSQGLGFLNLPFKITTNLMFCSKVFDILTLGKNLINTFWQLVCCSIIVLN